MSELRGREYSVKHARRILARTAQLAATVTLVGLVAACAPEPIAGVGGKGPNDSGQSQNESPTQSPDSDQDKGKDAFPSESSWGQPTDGSDFQQRVTELPENFPHDAFVVPETAVVYNAGEREDAAGMWFLVLQASDDETAAALWDEVNVANGFGVTNEVATSEGGISATLTSASAEVFVLTMPEPDGTVLLNYDIVVTPLAP